MIRLDEHVKITGKTLLVAGLIIFAVITRFYDLDARPYHHDESQYARYSYDLYDKYTYQYNPMLHGPFLFHLNALVFFLFGDSDYTARIAPAFLGILIVILPFALKKELSFYGAFIAGLLFAISPTFMFYSRFLRMDIYAAVTTLASVIAFIKYRQTLKPKYFYMFAVAFSLLFCSKENSYVHTAIFLAFFALYFLHRKIVAGAVLRGLFIGFIATAACLFFFNFLEHTENVSSLYIFIVLIIGLVFVSVIFYFQVDRSNEMEKIKTFFSTNWPSLVIAFVIFWGIFLLLYTTFFSNPGGFLDGIYRKSLNYWLGQNKERRIRGPFDFYLFLLVLYELPILLVMMGGMIRKVTENVKQFWTVIGFSLVSVVVLYFWGDVEWEKAKILHLDQLQHVVLFSFTLLIGILATFQYFRQNDHFMAFLVFWSIVAFLSYSYLGEKVPWLMMHVVMPQILLAGKLVADFLGSENFKQRRNAWIVLMLVGGFFLARNAIVLSFINYANPVERMHHTQATTDITKMINIMEDYAFRIQTEQPPYTDVKKMNNHFFHYDVPLGVVVDCKAAWPTSWYLRHYTNWTIVENPEFFNRAVIVIDYGKKDDHMEYLKDYYTEVEIKLWAMNQVEVQRGSWKDVLNYFLFREPFGVFADEKVLMYLRKDVTSGLSYEPLLENSEIIKKIAVKGQGKKIIINNIFEWGSFGKTGRFFQDPKDIAIDPKGFIYVLDSGNNRVQKFSPRGELMAIWGKKGTKNGEFNDPSGITIDNNGFVFVADTWNHRIQKFDSNGKFILSWTSDFWAPKGLSISPKGLLYVADTGKHMIKVFDLNGKLVKKFGDVGKLKGRFDEPVGIDFDPNGYLFVADTVNKRIQIFDRNDKFLKEWGVKGWPHRLSEPYIAIDSLNRVYVSDSENNRIEIFSPEGELLILWGKLGKGNGEFQKPKGLAIYQDKIYVVDSAGYRVQVFNIADIFKE